jgi:hypothetical protein
LLFHFQPPENADVDKNKGGRAKEGMKQKGNFVISNIPDDPVSVASLVT